ncbi:hypothetical protein [Sagittula sp.]|uniref:hypothetical protein n=1 Tax=Sagittula sp. TaxID=2038081 RepID=UPI003518B0E7
MTKKQPPLSQIAAAADHDPYKMRNLEWLLTLFDGGDFLAEVMEGHEQLMRDLLDHQREHGSKGCSGEMSIKISYAVGNGGDVGMGARAEFKPPKKPPSSAAAFINDAGELTLYSPMMARMQPGARPVDAYDPETGEVRDAD